MVLTWWQSSTTDRGEAAEGRDSGSCKSTHITSQMHIHSFTLQSLSVDDAAEMFGSRKTESTGQFHQQYTMIRHLQTNTHDCLTVTIYTICNNLIILQLCSLSPANYGRLNQFMVMMSFTINGVWAMCLNTRIGFSLKCCLNPDMELCIILLCVIVMLSDLFLF